MPRPVGTKEFWFIRKVRGWVGSELHGRPLQARKGKWLCQSAVTFSVGPSSL